MVKISPKILTLVLLLLIFANAVAFAWPVDYEYMSQYHSNGIFSAYITGFTSAAEICSYIYCRTDLIKDSTSSVIATDYKQNQTPYYSGIPWAQGSCIGSKHGKGTHRWTVDNISYFTTSTCYP